MRYPIFSALSLATLLLACAHDPNKNQVNEANTAQRSERGQAEGARAEAAEGAEDVTLPPRGERGRLASSDDELPRGREKAAGDSAEKGDLNVLDQGNGEIDLDLTQRIRKAVMAHDALSFMAKNAKIITRDGHVTLRGSVKSAAEKEAIYKCAVTEAGVGHVSNELEVDAD